MNGAQGRNRSANRRKAWVALFTALMRYGVHDKKCAAVAVPGRFGSAEGLRWNLSTDFQTCNCQLGAHLRGYDPREEK